MNQLVGKWKDLSSGPIYVFDYRGVYRKSPPNEPDSKATYNVSETTLLITVKATEPKQEIELTFSDDGNQVKLDWVDGTKSVCLTRIETEN